jgi:hypothetical protein
MDITHPGNGLNGAGRLLVLLGHRISVGGIFTRLEHAKERRLEAAVIAVDANT